MQLVKATPFAIRTPPPNYGGYFLYFVKLETDSGLVGWGECAVLFSMYGFERAFEQLVEGVFSRYLAGRDPMNREVLNKLMYAGLSSQHADYFVGGVISAFDTAMWDICGKALRVVRTARAVAEASIASTACLRTAGSSDLLSTSRM